MVSSPSSYKKPHIISMHLSQDHLQTFSLSGLWMMCDVISWCRMLEACWVWSTRVMMMISWDEVRWCSRARVSWMMITRDEASMLVSGCHDDEIMYHVMTVLCQGVKNDDIKGWSYIVYCVVSGCWRLVVGDLTPDVRWHSSGRVSWMMISRDDATVPVSESCCVWPGVSGNEGNHRNYSLRLTASWASWAPESSFYSARAALFGSAHRLLKFLRLVSQLMPGNRIHRKYARIARGLWCGKFCSSSHLFKCQNIKDICVKINFITHRVWI